MHKNLEKIVSIYYTDFMRGFNSLPDPIVDFIHSQKENYILWLPVFLSIGIGLYFNLSFEPGFTTAIIYTIPLLFLGVFSFFGFQKNEGHEFFKILHLLVVILALISLGFIAAKLRTEIVKSPVIEKETKPALVTGTIKHIDINLEKRTEIFILENLQIENFQASKTPLKIRITSRLKNLNLKPGMRIEALMVLQPFQPRLTEKSFDFRRYYFFEQIGGMGFMLKPPNILKSPPQSYELTLIKWREELRLKIEKILPLNSAGIVTALMTGERAQIQEEDWQNLRQSGLAHIISISGLHVAMVAASLFFAVRFFLALVPFFALTLPLKKIAAFIALLGCVLYVGFVVPTVPTTRALLMTGIALFAILIDRSPFSMRLVALSAFAILLILPESLWSASFQLSFAAMVLLVWFADISREFWSNLRQNAGFFKKIFLYILLSIATTIIATLATSPFSSFHFGQIANYSVLANALAIPLSGLLIMPMLIVSFLLLPFGDWVHFPLKLMGLGVDYMLQIAQFVASLPYAVTLTPSWSFYALLCFVAAGLILCLVIGRGAWAFILPLFAGIFILLFEPAVPRFFTTPDYKMIMAKDGDKIFISTKRGHNFAREEFLQNWGLDAQYTLAPFPKEGALSSQNLNINCERGACRLEFKNPKQNISFGDDFNALLEDCAWADIIITPQYFAPKACRSKIFDRGLYKTNKKGLRAWEY